MYKSSIVKILDVSNVDGVLVDSDSLVNMSYLEDVILTINSLYDLQHLNSRIRMLEISICYLFILFEQFMIMFVLYINLLLLRF